MQSILDALPDQPVHSLGVFRLQVTVNGKNRCEVGTRADPWFTSAFRFIVLKNSVFAADEKFTAGQAN